MPSAMRRGARPARSPHFVHVSGVPPPLGSDLAIVRARELPHLTAILRSLPAPALCLGLGLGLGLGSAAAAQDVPVHRAFSIDEGARPVVDGVLDEAVWRAASPLVDFHQSEPVEGGEPSEATEVRVLVDRESIFVGIVCFDADPAGIRATQARRDAVLDPDDRVELLFDTFRDQRSAFWFQIGAAGSRGDALVSRNGAEFNKQWDTLWHGRARITARGWEAEIEIPVASINFDPEATSWGFNVRRYIRRRSEEVRWATPSPRFPFVSPAVAGVLEGVGGFERGLGLDVKPFAVLDHLRERGGGSDLELDGGLDLFYRLTPDSKLSVTINTDFAETEVDDRQINLTRFPLFFPEKRDFFLEDSGAFFFGPGDDLGGDAIPFFSRRIGIDPYGAEVPLQVATKLTGRTDSFSYGVLDVQTDEQGGLESENLAVGRFSKNVLEQSDVGVIWTHGDPFDAGRRNTYGVDFNYRTSRFRGDRNLQFSTYALKSDSEGVSDHDAAYFAQGAYLNDEVQLIGDMTVIEESFDPALGFVPRRGIKKYRGMAAWAPRLHSSIRRLVFSVNPTLITGSDNDTESAAVTVRPLQIDWESGDNCYLNFTTRREVLADDFEIQPGNVIDADSYSYLRYGGVAHSSNKRAVSVAAAFQGGTFYDGRRQDYIATASWRPNAAATFDGRYERSDVDLPGGSFRVHVARSRLSFQFGPDLSWSNFVQWDNQSDSLGLNSRLWWIPRPGTELFLVLNQGWDVQEGGAVPGERQAAIKIGTTFRL